MKTILTIAALSLAIAAPAFAQDAKTVKPVEAPKTAQAAPAATTPATTPAPAAKPAAPATTTATAPAVAPKVEPAKTVPPVATQPAKTEVKPEATKK